MCAKFLIPSRWQVWLLKCTVWHDEDMPVTRTKVRARDVPYMTPAWKKAIGAKRRFLKRFSQNRTAENFELKKHWRNEAKRQRRISIRNYWSKVLNNFHQNPKNFYKTFKPFLDKKDKGDGTRDICLNFDSNLVRDQEGVTEHLVEYFSTIASGNGGKNVESLVKSDLDEHS